MTMIPELWPKEDGGCFFVVVWTQTAAESNGLVTSCLKLKLCVQRLYLIMYTV